MRDGTDYSQAVGVLAHGLCRSEICRDRADVHVALSEIGKTAANLYSGYPAEMGQSTCVRVTSHHHTDLKLGLGGYGIFFLCLFCRFFH